MRAAILAIGDELTFGESLDTNTAWLAAQLSDRAIEVTQHRTLGDDAELIGEAITELALTHDLIITTGGLGPTADDLTRQGVGLAVTPGRELVSDAEALHHLQELYQQRGREMPSTNLVQALRPETSTMIPNPNGTAMGLADLVGDCLVFALPGPPREMMPMFENYVVPQLPSVSDENVSVTRLVHAFGISESEAALRLGDLLARNRTPQIGITAGEAALTVRLRGHGRRDAVERDIRADVRAVREALHPFVYGEDNQTLSTAVGELLTKRNETVTTAESCTGGMLSAMLVDMAGSSTYFTGGWVTYSNEMKRKCLGVSEECLATYGAVSSEVARAMAIGALQESSAEYALSITGIAGPDGGTTEKPVGLVYIALAAKTPNTNPVVEIRRFIFVGDRLRIRQRAAHTALQMLRFALLGVSPSTSLSWEVQKDLPASSDTAVALNPTAKTSDGI